MKRFGLSAIPIALLGAGVGQADDGPTGPAGGTDHLLAAVETPEMRWSDFRLAESTLAPQINAVFATRNSRRMIASPDANGGAGEPVEMAAVTVNAMDATATEASASGPRAGQCLHMAKPGSRIMRERCFYEDPGEAALNDYQFRAEIEQMLEQNARDFLEVAEYSLGYRRSLAEAGR
jgi:hypothetical protein